MDQEGQWLTRSREGSTAFGRTATDAADAARIAAETRNKRREEDRSCVIRKGWRGKEHDCWSALPGHFHGMRSSAFQ
jgi:hypothetical protein